LRGSNGLHKETKNSPAGLAAQTGIVLLYRLSHTLGNLLFEEFSGDGRKASDSTLGVVAMQLGGVVSALSIGVEESVTATDAGVGVGSRRSFHFLVTVAR
jgi:hypothetical protein